MFLCVQISDVREPSVKASCGLVDEEMVNCHAGVEVPIPTRVLSLPEFGYMALVNGPVEVAQCVSGAPPPPSSASQPNLPAPSYVRTLLD
jgi:hypothetical protein